MKNGNKASAVPFPWTSERFRRPAAVRERNVAGIAEASPPLLDHPSKLFVEITTRCNLACGMCVKQSPGSGILTGDMSREVFLSLLPAFPKIRSLILNGIGEPLLHPELVEFIRIAKRVMPKDGVVGFQTNGILLNDALAESLVQAGLDRICLSLDSVCRDTFARIRSGGDVEDLRKAFRSLAAAREKNPGSPLRVGVEYVVMRDNLHQLPEVLRWAASLGARFAIVTHLLPYDSSQVLQPVFDANLDRAVDLYRRWKRRAEAEGIELDRYFFINFYKFFRTPEEQRVVDFVREMVDDARDRNIFFHLRNLIARDDGMSSEVERVFDGAKNVAEELGIDLILPAVSPRSERRCDFVEDGSAMVSWDGGVHPCYFLWHRYQCHFSYWRKYVPGLEAPWGSSTALHFTYWRKSVAAKVFGSLGEKGILEIWNDPSFLEFRKEVLRDEYPYCSNCSLVPCDYLTADEFEHDCFDTAVPCGDCFWGLGMFNCLQ
ncbi:MAG: radical SAM/SPASM family putative metalloenzyme maturase [Geobacteraceae bacterium]|nr:radical SAM/SPASM family putative metalloenzyme maturase [Geobacteraceae bacterium]